MINFIESEIKALAAHYIGSASEDQDISFSKEAVAIADPELHQTLLKFFLSHYREPAFSAFTYTSDELELNPVYNFVGNIFDDPACIHEQSVKIARHLFEKSKHPNIKPGEMIVTYIENVLVDDEMVEAVGIFKLEEKDLFLQFEVVKTDISIKQEHGTDIRRIDKGCLIFNTERESGFKILNIDHSNRNREAMFWKDDFLVLKPRSNDYLQTKEYIQLTKNFIKGQMSKEFDTEKSDEAAAMHRSQEYFKYNEKFDAEEYELQVFKDSKVIDSFQDYRNTYEEFNGQNLAESFDISDVAVKKMSRVFKSIIKLDKNFHIYVHGDRNKIQKGVDDEGNKYYILYYNDEQ
jgi:hypothetical protein